jgi:hypothetical protein
LNQYGMQGKEVIVPVHALGEYPSHLTPVEVQRDHARSRTGIIQMPR